MYLCEWIENLWYRWTVKTYQGPLKRSAEWEAKVKQLLLEDLQPMKYKVIHE